MVAIRVLDAALAMGAIQQVGGATATVGRVCIDSRDVRAGDLFFAIRGPRFDGHDFLDEAERRGAAAMVVSDRGAMSIVRRTPLLLVDDVVSALGRLATYYRERLISPQTVVIAVTGSNGKTTTKCMIDHVLGARFPGRASPKSFNNQIGVPLTILLSEPGDRYLVCEIGTNSPGEIGRLASMVQPDVAVISSIGEAHLEGLGTIDDVAREKATILDHVRPGGFALVNVDRAEIHPFVQSRPKVRVVSFGFNPSARLRVTNSRVTLRGSSCELENRYRIELPMPGVHHAVNAAASFAVGRWLGMAPEEILDRLACFEPPEGRTRVMGIAAGRLVDDAYNANPASVRAAIAALRSERPGRRAFVLGDMLELGSASGVHHEAVLDDLAASGVERLIAFGDRSCSAAAALVAASSSKMEISLCSSISDVVMEIAPLLENGWTVWVKGSRGMAMDKAIAAVLAMHPAQSAVA